MNNTDQKPWVNPGAREGEVVPSFYIS